jgi:hypothetical protein
MITATPLIGVYDKLGNDKLVMYQGEVENDERSSHGSLTWLR